MTKKSASTPATQWLQEKNIIFSEHIYNYEPHGGANEAAHKLELPPHHTVKTLVMEDENKKPLIILMHGDQTVSTKNLARQTGAKHVEPCSPITAQRHTGYLVGGTSPFGLRKPLPIWVQESILPLEKIYINGGKRGFLIGISPLVLTEHLAAIPVNVSLN